MHENSEHSFSILRFGASNVDIWCEQISDYEDKVCSFDTKDKSYVSCAPGMLLIDRSILLFSFHHLIFVYHFPGGTKRIHPKGSCLKILDGTVKYGPLKKCNLEYSLIFTLLNSSVRPIPKKRIGTLRMGRLKSSNSYISLSRIFPTTEVFA